MNEWLKALNKGSEQYRQQMEINKRSKQGERSKKFDNMQEAHRWAYLEDWQSIMGDEFSEELVQKVEEYPSNLKSWNFHFITEFRVKKWAEYVSKTREGEENHPV